MVIQKRRLVTSRNQSNSILTSFLVPFIVVQPLAKSADSSPKSLPIQFISSEYPLSESRSVSKATSKISITPNCSEQKGPSDFADVAARHESPANKSAGSESIPGIKESPRLAVSEQLRFSYIPDLPLSSIAQQRLRLNFVTGVPRASISNSVNSKSEPNSPASISMSESANDLSLRVQLAQGF